MKKRTFGFISRSITLVVLFIFLNISLIAQQLDTVLIKTRQLSANEIVKLYAISCEVEIQSGAANEIMIEYHLEFEAETQAELNEFFIAMEKSIDNQMKTGYAERIYFPVPYDNMSTKLNQTKLSFKNSSQKYKITDFKRRIVVYMPKQNVLDFKASFSKLAINVDLESNVILNLSSSKLEMGNCKDLDLKTSFSNNMIIGNVENAKMNLSSSSLEMRAINKDLKLKASFSALDVERIVNNADIELNSSKFETESIEKLDLKASFVRLFDVNSVESANLSLSSSEIEIAKINSMDISMASFSTFRIKDVHSINIDRVNSSKFFIENVANVEANECSFSDFKIDKLSSSFSAKSNSGSIDIKELMEDFINLSIVGQFVNIDIDSEEECNFTFSADLSFSSYSFGDLDFTIEEKSVNQKIITGSKGNKTEAKSAMNFDCKSCKIKLN